MKSKNKVLRILALMSLIALLLSGCVTLNTGQTWTVDYNNCPQGQVTHIFFTVTGMGPAGVSIVNNPGVLEVGDEVTATLNCGFGEETFAFGKISAIDWKNDKVTIDEYSTPVKK